MIRRDRNGIPVIDGVFSRVEILMLKEKDPCECGKRYNTDRVNPKYPTLRKALEKIGK